MQKSTTLSSWDDLRFFVAVAEHGSMSSAARALGVEQSTISRRLGRIEDELGVQLFDRTPEGARLTASGEALLQDAQAVSGHVKAIQDRAAGLESRVEGLVRISMTETMASLMVLPRLGALLEQHPNLRVEIRTGVELDDVLRRETDIAVRNIRPDHPDLVSRHLLTLEHGTYATPAYLARAGWPCAPQALNWIAPRAENTPYQHAIRQAFGAEPRVLVQSFQAQLDAVLADIGPAIVTRFEAELFGLEDLELALPFPPIELSMVTHRALRRVPRIRVVMDWLLELATQVERGVTTDKSGRGPT